MNKKNKIISAVRNWEKSAKIFLNVVVVFIIAYMIIGGIAFPSERDSFKTKCRYFESEWEQILENGERIPADVPGTEPVNIPAEYGEVVTLSTKLPEEIINGENLCFRPIWQDVEIYIDGELRKSYTTKDTRPFGKNSPMRYIFVELSEEDEGKELIYKFSSESKYAGNVQRIRIGDNASIWFQFVVDTGFKTLLSIVLIIMSIFCIIVCLILKVVYKKTLSLIYLAWVVFFCAFWMISESDFRQILFGNISVLSNLTYWCLMMIGFPLMMYINDIQNGRHRKVYILPTVYSVVVFVVSTILQAFDIKQFVQIITFIHVCLITSIVCILLTITIDVFKKQIKDYLFVGIGVYGMLLTAILEMAFYYTGVTVSLGTILGIGLSFLLIMAIIKTGQDLFSIEKKKQEAVVARDAQAKFLANMSHEIRTPINVIIGMNEMILRENEVQTVEDYAHNIESASNMLLGLINDVLDFSKIESGQLELVEDNYDFAKLVQDEVLLLKARSAGKPLSTKIEIDSQIPSKLFGDELRIKQVLTNLLSNAVKYTRGGSVTLKAFFKQMDEENIELGFSVIDTGIGIKKEDLSKLFDSFKRLELDKNRNVQGTGLGLNIAKQLVELMNGKIIVDSVYGEGSNFTILIPQKVIDKKPVEDWQKSLHVNRTKKVPKKALFTAPEAKILIVDDNTVNLTLMKGLLKRTQIQVDTVKSGKESLEITKDKKYDIIFMDHMMPELDGIETLELLRAEADNPNKDGIVIALTANAIAGCKEMYLSYGFNDYFAKPIQADKLEEMLVEYLPKQYVNMN